MQKRFQLAGESTDPRAIRARDQIAFALLALAGEKRYDDITVQDIAQRARISRSTFYAHFQDRDGIVIRLSVVFGGYLGGQLRWDKATGQFRFPLASLLEHMLDIRALYDSLSRARRADDLLKIFRINLATGFERRIESARRRTTASDIRAATASGAKLPAPLLAQHIAGTVAHLLMWWLEHHCRAAPKTMDEHFHRLIAGLR